MLFSFIFAEIVCVSLQIVLFVPFYLMWVKDCKKYGKNNLAVGLGKRFACWGLCFPLWLVPILQLR